MVSVAQLVERRIVAPVAEGSTPFTHPNFCGICARSSVGQSVGLRIRRPGVRVAPGVLESTIYGPLAQQVEQLTLNQ